VLHFWTHFFGESGVALRPLSGIFYVAAAWTVYLGGKSLFHEKRAALYAAFFYLVGMQAIHQAQNVRMYASLGCSLRRLHGLIPRHICRWKQYETELDPVHRS
jgi:uncharacterized membrane protein